LNPTGVSDDLSADPVEADISAPRQRSSRQRRSGTLEGIVTKWKRGPYLSGDVTSWMKIKNRS